MSDGEKSPSFQGKFLAQPMGPLGIVLFLVYFAALSTLALEFLIGAWPTHSQPTAFLWGLVKISLGTDADLRLALVAVTAGALGAFVHSATSFVTFLGNRKLIRSWAGWYILRPLIGMALALMFYLLIRAGLVAPSSNGSAVSPFGVAAIAALAGMFSKESVDKLREIFQEVVKPPAHEEKQRLDKLTDPAPDGDASAGSTG